MTPDRACVHASACSAAYRPHRASEAVIELLGSACEAALAAPRLWVLHGAASSGMSTVIGQAAARWPHLPVDYVAGRCVAVDADGSQSAAASSAPRRARVLHVDARAAVTAAGLSRCIMQSVLPAHERFKRDVDRFASLDKAAAVVDAAGVSLVVFDSMGSDVVRSTGPARFVMRAVEAVLGVGASAMLCGRTSDLAPMSELLREQSCYAGTLQMPDYTRMAELREVIQALEPAMQLRDRLDLHQDAAVVRIASVIAAQGLGKLVEAMMSAATHSTHTTASAIATRLMQFALAGPSPGGFDAKAPLEVPHAQDLRDMA